MKNLEWFCVSGQKTKLLSGTKFVFDEKFWTIFNLGIIQWLFGLYLTENLEFVFNGEINWFFCLGKNLVTTTT